MALGFEPGHGVGGERDHVERLAGAHALGGVDAADRLDGDAFARRRLVGFGELGEDPPRRHRGNAGDRLRHDGLQSKVGVGSAWYSAAARRFHPSQAFGLWKRRGAP